MQDGVHDRWKWLLDPINGFSISDVNHIQFKTLHGLTQLMFGSLKIFLFSLHLFHNRPPTKDNLITRGIIQAEANACLGGCGIQESADHLFITCRHFSQLWTQIFSWLRISSVDFFCANNNFHQFNQLGGFPRQTHLFLKLIWFTFVWTI